MNKQERAYAILRERILDGTYGPGYRLVIDTLARELGVSPVPVREAIRRLEAEGWVIYRPNAGAHVAPLDPSQWEEAMAVLALLEGYATALAMEHLTAADLDSLRQINRDMAAALDGVDVLAFSRLNADFHFIIYNRCPNGYLIEVLKQTWGRLDALRQTVFHYIPSRGRVSLREHEELIDLLARGADTGDIERVAREHKLHTVRAYREAQARPAVPARRLTEGEE